MVVACSYKILWPKIDFLIFLPHFPLSTGHFFQNVTDTSKSLRFQKTQMFSQIIDQKEHKNNRYKFEPATWCYKQPLLYMPLNSKCLIMIHVNLGRTVYIWRQCTLYCTVSPRYIPLRGWRWAHWGSVRHWQRWLHRQKEEEEEEEGRQRCR